jgi:hypothetical protein
MPFPYREFSVGVATNIGGPGAQQGCDELAGAMIHQFRWITQCASEAKGLEGLNGPAQGARRAAVPVRPTCGSIPFLAPTHFN